MLTACTRPTMSRVVHRRARTRISASLALCALFGATMSSAACTSASRQTPSAGLQAGDEAFLDSLQRRTFDYFWETTNPRNGLAPDRWPNPPFASIAALGFALTAYPIGAERGWITRGQAAERTLTTLRFMHGLPQGPDSTGIGGYRGFFYHFLDMETGLRFGTTELSTIDTALLLAGALFCREYFDGHDDREVVIRAYADSLVAAPEWQWFVRSPPRVQMAWRPERAFGPALWAGYNEGMLLYVLALASSTSPVDPAAWDAWTATYRWGPFYGQEHANFPPMFGHQYSHVWIDFRGIQDQYMREHGIDYFENSRRATIAQREYAIDNPSGYGDYGSDIWGLTASDGPADTTIVIDGVSRRFRTYWARGAAMIDIRDDGTIAPTAAGGSIPFAPEITIPALRAMRERYGDDLYTHHGFLDAFNPTLQDTGVRLRRGRVVAGKGWFDDNYIGIDQGPILAMIENHRSGLIWETMRRSPYIVRGLCRAGFAGGWLEGRC